MKVMCDVFHLKPELKDAFLEALTENARGSVAGEPGCLRFDVCLDEKDPNIITVYEVYRDEEAWETHRQGPHLQGFRRARDQVLGPQHTIRDWCTQEPILYRWTNVFPSDAEWTE